MYSIIPIFTDEIGLKLLQSSASFKYIAFLNYFVFKVRGNYGYEDANNRSKLLCTTNEFIWSKNWIYSSHVAKVSLNCGLTAISVVNAGMEEYTYSLS